MIKQTALFATTDAEGPQGATSTFIRNMKLPVHGWFRFPAGFSAQWVLSVVSDAQRAVPGLRLFDPFAGVGTTVLAGEEAGVGAIGLEAQPFVQRIAHAKLMWHVSPKTFERAANEVLKHARLLRGRVPEYPPLIRKCYPEESLAALHRLKTAWQESGDDEPTSQLVWLAVASILRACAPVGTAPWQYILPNKGAKAVAPFRAFTLQVRRMADDMRQRQAAGVQPRGQVLLGDARQCEPVSDRSVDLVVTSPPYANNYDYADATRLEMTFFGEVESWADLHNAARHGLVRSCSQHFSKGAAELDDLLADLAQTPIQGPAEQACRALAKVRLTHGGKKQYHLMVAAYFGDMLHVWTSLRRVCKDGASVCFVIGDSAPYGVYVPVHEWLEELALYVGFRECRFEKIRDRNVKWKNRKHRVPLCEGRLWVAA